MVLLLRRPAIVMHVSLLVLAVVWRGGECRGRVDGAAADWPGILGGKGVRIELELFSRLFKCWLALLPWKLAHKARETLTTCSLGAAHKCTGRVVRLDEISGKERLRFRLLHDMKKKTLHVGLKWFEVSLRWFQDATNSIRSYSIFWCLKFCGKMSESHAVLWIRGDDLTGRDKAVEDREIC